MQQQPHHIKIDELKMRVLLALEEDIGSGDITTESIVPQDAAARARIVAKEEGILAGIEVAAEVFRTLDPATGFEAKAGDGDAVAPGKSIATIEGNASALLKGERTALNFLQRLSGIATLTRKFVDAVAGTGAKIYDTRKTTPGWRSLEKHAVACGGGTNHRMGLYDAVLIKENHIAIAREKDKGIKELIEGVRKKVGPDLFLQIEARNLEEVAKCLSAAPDCILLDNMSTAEMQQAVLMGKKTNDRVLFEASGGVTLDNVREIASTGVHRISVGALTHSAPALDITILFETGD